MVSGEDFWLNQSTEVNSIFMAVELEFEGRFNGQELNRSDALDKDLSWELWAFMDIYGHQIVKFYSLDSKYIQKVVVVASWVLIFDPKSH